MKKLFSIILAVIMLLSAISSAAADNSPIRIWVAENAKEFTEAQINEFVAANPEYAGYSYVVEPMGEGDAAGEVIADIESAADVFGFAQDQMSRLIAAGALSQVKDENARKIEAENDAGSVKAAKVGDKIYAYPMTSDNGYFMYYDKTVLTDPTDLARILADCEAAGKNFYMEINSGWYQPAFFFAYGCKLSYETDNAGTYTGLKTDYASEAGVKALKAMIEMAKSPAFQNGSSLTTATNVGAIIDGVWDENTAKELFGSNYAAAKLPSVNGVQLSGFGGFKMMGVKQQGNADRQSACDALAAYLTSGDVQLARYRALGWGPSNLAAQQDEAIQSDAALSALAEQLPYTVPQGQIPGYYWDAASELGDDILSHRLQDADDATLLSVLKTLSEKFRGSIPDTGTDDPGQGDIAPAQAIYDFVNRNYSLILSREADPEGQKNWAEALAKGTISGGELMYGFVNSEEFKQKPLSNEEKVEIMYNVMLGRGSDPEGLEHWVLQLNLGMSINAIAAGFVGSQEFIGLCSDYGIQNGTYRIDEDRDRNAGVTGFVNRCYDKALSRNPDTDGLNYWCGQLLGKNQTAQQVAHGFIESEEMKNKGQSNEEYVRTMYELFLDREPDADGFRYWTEKLAAGESRETIENGFAQSVEFREIVAGYGVE